MLDEPRYQKLADEVLRRLDRSLGDLDPDLVDCELAGDVLTITLRGKVKCIVNTQRPTRQIWVAAAARAWHFAYDEAADRWYDEKDKTNELFTRVGQIVKEQAGVEVPLSG